jgi:hypothetical protein
MVFLVPVPQALDDPHRFIRAGGLYVDGLEPTFERAVLLDVFTIFVERRGADALNLAAGTTPA